MFSSLRIQVCINSGARYFANSSSSTLKSYTSDQLFIHLDDLLEDVQNAVFQVLVEGVAAVDSELVLKKAEACKVSQRSPHLCDKVIHHIQQSGGAVDPSS